MGSADPPWKNGWKIKKRKHAKKSSFLCLRCLLRAIRAGRCRERRYSDHVFIQIYFRMHHFVIRFSKFSSPQAAGGIDSPALTKVMRTFMASYVGWQRGTGAPLLLSAGPPDVQQSIDDISCPPGPQQQTGSSGRDRRTDGLTPDSYIEPARHSSRSANNTQCALRCIE